MIFPSCPGRGLAPLPVVGVAEGGEGRAPVGDGKPVGARKTRFLPRGWEVQCVTKDVSAVSLLVLTQHLLESRDVGGSC